MVLVFTCLAAVGQNKSIRLRNGIITPPSPAANSSAQRLQPRISSAPASGLYLIQFKNHPTATEREQLQSMGVHLLKYVPDDAFIARLRNVSPDKVQALDFIHWVGTYDADYKIAPRLSAAAGKAQTKATGMTTNVSVLLSPGATAAEIAGVKSFFSTVQRQSDLRMGTILRGRLHLNQLPALAASDAVLWIEPEPKHKLVDEAASKLVGGDDGNVATPTVTEQLGFDGNGVTVCVADTGLDTGDTNTMHPDLNGRVTGFQFYGDLTDGSDGYGHGTHCAGIIAGNAATGETDPDSGQFYGLGVASGADLFIERIFDDNAAEVDPFPGDETLATDAVRAGAQIGANSWGNDVNGEYDIDAAAFDELVRDADPSTPDDQPYILEFSAGNAGAESGTIGSPASAKNVIATGASENVPGTLAQTYGLYADGPDTMADFSSRGPCEDGRIKPDVVAPGTWIASLRSSYAFNEDAIAWGTIDDYYVYMGGTSMSGPAAAGAAAVFVQYYKSLHDGAVPSPALVKAALINSAEELDNNNGGPGPAPNFDEGWGRVTLTNLITTNFDEAPRNFQFFDQGALLMTGQTYGQHTLVRSSSQPLKITLAYTDVPGFPGAIPALVNDLDLEVVAPDGTLYRGNQFVGDESIPNAPTPDDINNVEGVYISNPMPGDYVVRVRATNVPEDARLDTAQIDQDFALVASGDLARSGSGNILLDRTSYTAPGIINVTVFDLARAASNSVSITVKSTTEPAGETIVLNSAGHYGAFTGAVATLVGSAVADGKLEIHNGDSIEADYLDQFGNLKTATATADLITPAINNVAATIDLGVNTVTWQTSEAANSIIHYGTNSLNLNLGATNSALVTSHSMKLSRLVPGKTYYFSVTSSDAAGNTVTDNNSGVFYSFVAVATPTVLLVDDYDAAGEANAGSPVIDDGTYTNAIAAAGYSYAHWKVLDRGSPQLTDLQPYPVVIWRTTDDIVNYGYDSDGFPDPNATNNTLNASQQFALQNYVNGGGSFFMASMNILEQIGNVSFRRNVLHVNKFIQNSDPPAPCDTCDEDYGVPEFFGASGNPISDGMYVTLDYNNYPTFDIGDGTVLGPDFSDTFTPDNKSTPICFESSSAKACGVSYPAVGQDSPGRIVFLSFPLDAMPTNQAAPNNEVTLLRNAFQFLAPGANGKGTVSLDKSSYTLPDQVIVEVGDSDLIGTGNTIVRFTNNATAAHVTVTLRETAHPGLFRGAMTLVASGAATNELLAADGNSISASYFDASRGSNVVATATIDTEAPAITNVTASADVGSATISWTTSKPSDSLVQYGESTILSHTAYNAKPVTNHVVALSGLLADHIYYFQVTSRDAAGNSTVDNNGGAFYTFTTFPTPKPPWSDDLESGAPGWTVVPDPVNGSGMNWTLGTPNNGLQTSANSGTNAWGSDINGQQFSGNSGLASSFLYSPAIDLSGLSSATLIFWDCFDFSSGFESGQLGISTNSSTPPGDIPTLIDFSGQTSDGWQEETLDLTPYVGQTIQVVWYYQGISFGSPLYGWLVDDVSITNVVVATNSGTVVVSKNLGEGTFTLTGPIGRTGKAPMTIVSNAPPGEYKVKFSDVAFYETPASQTNTLADNGTLTFTGNYTFIDANHNGISDAWENHYFGSAGADRTQFTDSDGDGMSDYAEFIAGTNPTNAASKFIFVSAAVQTNHVQLKWSVVPGRLYQLESSTNLADWLPLTDWQQAVTSPMSYSGTNAATGMRFFRVDVEP